MRLLIVDCGKSSLTPALVAEANKLVPKAQAICSMYVDVDNFSVGPFRVTLRTLFPDTIIVIPPSEAQLTSNWRSFLKEVTRQAEMMIGRVGFISSAEVLGDAWQRTELATPMPLSTIGEFLFQAEDIIAHATPRYFVFRTPFLIDGPEAEAFKSRTNVQFTVGKSEELANPIMHWIQKGWFGVYHLSPNSSVLLHDSSETSRVLNYTLASRHTWATLTKSEVLWDAFVNQRG